jgi:hypothetical protein
MSLFENHLVKKNVKELGFDVIMLTSIFRHAVSYNRKNKIILRTYSVMLKMQKKISTYLAISSSHSLE